MAHYLDTSAAVKLVVAETESAALHAWVTEPGRELAACDLLRTELLRATRCAAPEAMVRAREVLDSVTLTVVRTALFERAAELSPPLLRTPDAVHLAAALDLGDDLEGLVTYDDRLADAAHLHGIAVLKPS